MVNELEEKIMTDFIRNNQEKFYRVAYSYVKNRDTALDVVQDAIVKALDKRDTLRNSEYLKTWFYRILINECLTTLRKNKKILYFHSLDQCETEQVEDGTADSKLDLYKSIDKLTPKLKTIIILRFFEEMKLEEISEVTKININTVKSQLYRAIKILKMDMEEEHYDR